MRRDGLLLVPSTALLLVVALDGRLSALEGTAWLLRTTVLVVGLFYTEDTLGRLEGGLLVAANAANWLWNLL